MDLFPVFCNLGSLPRMRMITINITPCSEVYLFDFAFEFTPRSIMDPIILKGQIMSNNIGVCLEAALISIGDQLQEYDDRFKFMCEYEHTGLKKYIREQLTEYRDSVLAEKSRLKKYVVSDQVGDYVLSTDCINEALECVQEGNSTLDLARLEGTYALGELVDGSYSFDLH